MAIKVLEFNLDEPTQQLQLSKEYKYCRVLVRSGKQPFGWISFAPDKRVRISGERLCRLMQRQLDYTIIHQALVKLFEPVASEHTEEWISVVVCTRNRTHSLARCLKSLMALDYMNFEIIVVDNAPSTDETFQLVKSLPVRYVREDCPGLDWARNRGIAEAKYPIVAFTDDDVRVDSYWLKAISKTFAQKDVMGVSGFVAPAELETFAQRVFELQYGGMGHGFTPSIIRKEHLSDRRLMWISNVCIGANMAFRKEVFDKIGGFDTALDVGTPSHGGGDIEIFHRLVAKNFVIAYEPSMLVWHYHRREWAALRKQIYDNGRSFGCYLIHCYRHRTLSRMSIIRFFLVGWLLKWNLKNLLSRKTKIPRVLSFVELMGMVTSPFAYITTVQRDKEIRRKYKTRAGQYIHKVNEEKQAASPIEEVMNHC